MRFREREAEAERIWQKWLEMHVASVAGMLALDTRMQHAFKAGVHLLLQEQASPNALPTDEGN